ncbi:MAG: SIMPL domain-containing protein [Nitrososphaerota archaeon]
MERQIVYSIVASAMALLALGIATTVALSPWLTTMEGQTAPTSEDIISVTGIAQATVTPDTAIIWLTVQERAATSYEALNLAATAASEVVEALKSAGMPEENLKTTGFSIQPEYVYVEGEPPRLVGYVASYSLEIKTAELRRVGELIDRAVSAGADIVGGVSMTISDDLSARLSRDLLSAAVTDARRKAELALAPLGLNVARLKSLNIMEQYPYPIFRGAVPAERTDGLPVVPGQTTFSVSVQATFVIGS